MNDGNYKLLMQLKPTPTPEEAISILAARQFGSVAGLSRQIHVSETAIHRVLKKGEILPLVQKEIINALGMSINPWSK